MAWFFLILAAACEMVWPLGFKYSAGFTRIWPTAGTFAVMIVSFFCLSRATAAGIPIGTAYAVWTGLGAVTQPVTAKNMIVIPSVARNPGIIAWRL